jgi:sulfate permease, SulP family
MVYFISDTILTGFKIGAGLVIASTQLPKLVGVGSSAHGLLPAITDLARHIGEIHAPSAAIGVGALVLLLAADALLPHRPVSPLIVAAAIALGSFYDLGALGVRLVGEVPAGLPYPGLPSLAPEEVTSLLPLAFACFLLAYVEGTSVARAIADRDGDRVDTNQELLALGAVNLAVSLGRGYPVSGGTSQSAVNDTAGAETPVALVVTSTLVAVILLFATGLFRNLPEPVLAALVIAAVTRLVRTEQLRALWMLSGSAFAVAMLTVLGVMALGILQGILVAAFFSLALTIRAVASPRISVLARLPGTTLFREIARHSNSERIPGTLIVRPEAELVYFNVSSVADQVLDLVATSSEPIHVVVVDLSLTPTLDVSTAHALGALYDRLAAGGTRLRLAEVYPAAREMLRTLEMEERFGPLDTRTTMADAVAATTMRTVA